MGIVMKYIIWHLIGQKVLLLVLFLLFQTGCVSDWKPGYACNEWPRSNIKLWFTIERKQIIETKILRKFLEHMMQVTQMKTFSFLLKLKSSIKSRPTRKQETAIPCEY